MILNLNHIWAWKRNDPLWKHFLFSGDTQHTWSKLHPWCHPDNLLPLWLWATWDQTKSVIYMYMYPFWTLRIKSLWGCCVARLLLDGSSISYINVSSAAPNLPGLIWPVGQASETFMGTPTSGTALHSEDGGGCGETTTPVFLPLL